MTAVYQSPAAVRPPVAHFPVVHLPADIVERASSPAVADHLRSPALPYTPIVFTRSVDTEAAPAPIICMHCNSRDLCLPATLQQKNPAMLRGVFGNSRRVRRGEAIYRAGDTFENLYVARAGSSKTVAILPDGREQITGFQISGEFVGMEGLTTGKHTLDAIALEDSMVCVIPFRALETLSREDRDLQHHLYQLMSREIVRESAHLMLIGSMNAEERVAAFLMNLSQRYSERGYSPTEFHLRMSREEIGCYLGLKLETVSRMMSRLQRRGIIEMRSKETRIVDLEGLAHV